MAKTKSQHVPYEKSIVFYVILAIPVGGILSSFIDNLVSEGNIKMGLHRITWFCLGIIVATLASYQKNKWRIENKHNQSINTNDVNQNTTPVAPHTS